MAMVYGTLITTNKNIEEIKVKIQVEEEIKAKAKVDMKKRR